MSVPRWGLTLICIAALGLGVVPSASAAFDDPLFVYTPRSTDKKPVPPVGTFAGPCGLAVSSTGSFYLSDYYHQVVDVFSPNLTFSDPIPHPEYLGQPLSAFSLGTNPHTGPLDDPCGLGFDSSEALYVNNYHRNVVRFPVPISLSNPNNEVIDTGDPTNVYANPTGVAVHSATSHAYIDDRTYVAERISAGTLVQKVGEGTLQDGYGIAVSGFAATAGRLYVPDAATKTVKVYNPETSTTNPIASFSRPGGFGSLVDSAVAVDNSTGEIYVVDTIGPQPTESPLAVVYVFNAAGGYEGRLKHATIDAAPTGLAVDNSGTATQSRVYVTSGIDEASLYAYPPHAATSASAPPLGLSKGGAQGSSAGAGVAAASQSAGGPVSASTSDSSQSAAPRQARKATARRHRRAARRHAGRRHRKGARAERGRR